MNEAPDLTVNQIDAVRRLQALLREAADLIPQAFGLPAGAFAEIPLYDSGEPTAEQQARSVRIASIVKAAKDWIGEKEAVCAAIESPTATVQAEPGA